MQIRGITMECADPAEVLDALDEIRSLIWLAEDGEADLGPAVRSLLAGAYLAAEEALSARGVDPSGWTP
jgi:hypothetical protein